MICSCSVTILLGNYYFSLLFYFFAGVLPPCCRNHWKMRARVRTKHLPNRVPERPPLFPQSHDPDGFRSFLGREASANMASRFPYSLQWIHRRKKAANPGGFGGGQPVLQDGAVVRCTSAWPGSDAHFNWDFPKYCLAFFGIPLLIIIPSILGSTIPYHPYHHHIGQYNNVGDCWNIGWL